MAPPRPLPGAPGSHAVGANTSVCPQNHRCHCEGKGIVKFGDGFKQSMVRRLANNAVVLQNNDGKRLASGTVIETGKYGSESKIGDGGMVPSAVVLCATHSLGTVTPTDLSVLVPYRLGKDVAPGSSWELVNDKAKWLPSAPLYSSYMTGRVTKQLEAGSSDIDYAILLVEFGLLTGSPAKPYRPMSRSLGEELCHVGHPYQTQYDCEPAQASAGKIIAPRVPFDGGSTDYFATAYLSCYFGSSGGGVYNSSGELVGVMKGKTADKLTAFLNLGAVVDAKPKGTELLQQYMAGTKMLIDI